MRCNIYRFGTIFCIFLTRLLKFFSKEVLDSILTSIAVLKISTIISSGSFLIDSKNIILYGPPGTGKTHLSIAIGRQLCLKGFKILFITACELVQNLIKASKDLHLSDYCKKLRRYELICIDEFGFIPFNRNESDLLFQFISDRYERASILITTNLVFSEWDKIFKDNATTSAVVDRLVHHCLIVECKGDSYRTRK